MLVPGMLMLFGPETVTIMQALLVMLILSWVGLFALEKGVQPLIVMLALALTLLFTVLPLAMLTHLRDAMNGVALSSFAVLAFAWSRHLKKGGFSFWMMIALLFLGMLLALLRIDNLAFLFPFLILLGIINRHRPKVWLVILGMGICWLGTNSLVERLLLPDRQACQIEKSQYQVTAYINPLLGAFTSNSLPQSARLELGNTLNKVINIDRTKNYWSPYDIVYWHQFNKGAPDPEVLAKLGQQYRSLCFKEFPLFLRMRLATFCGTLGHIPLGNRFVDWSSNRQVDACVSFNDHFVSQDPKWQQMRAMIGFSQDAHPFDAQVKFLLRYWGQIGTLLPQLLLVGICVLFLRMAPEVGILALAELCRVGVFLAFEPASVFLYLSELLILGVVLPLLLLASREGVTAKGNMT
jgi:hypothetical protein